MRDVHADAHAQFERDGFYSLMALSEYCNFCTHTLVLSLDCWLTVYSTLPASLEQLRNSTFQDPSAGWEDEFADAAFTLLYLFQSAVT